MHHSGDPPTRPSSPGRPPPPAMPRTLARPLSRAAVLLLLALTAGCGLPRRGVPRVPPPREHAALEGTWEDPQTRDRHRIRWDGVRQRFYVPWVESSSGERYTVVDVDWDGERLSWGFRIPSGAYVITLRTREVEDDVLRCDWSDSEGVTAEQLLYRVRE